MQMFAKMMSFDDILDLTDAVFCVLFPNIRMYPGNILLYATSACTHTAPARAAAAKTKGRTGSIITKLPHPEKHPVNSCRGVCPYVLIMVDRDWRSSGSEMEARSKPE